jgi:hypothetical protein
MWERYLINWIYSLKKRVKLLIYFITFQEQKHKMFVWKFATIDIELFLHLLSAKLVLIVKGIKIVRILAVATESFLGYAFEKPLGFTNFKQIRFDNYRRVAYRSRIRSKLLEFWNICNFYKKNTVFLAVFPRHRRLSKVLVPKQDQHRLSKDQPISAW